MSAGTLWRDGQGFLPTPETDKSIWHPSPLSMPLAGSSDSNYSSVFKELPPSLLS